MITLYLSNYRLQAAVGDGGKQARIAKCVSTSEISAGMFNGNVTDRELFVRVVKNFFATNDLPTKNVALVLNTTQIVTRELRVPMQKDAQTLSYIANEMADVERTQTPVYAFETLDADKKTKFRKVLAYVADKSFLQGYVELFEACGITLSSIRPALTCALRALAGQNLGRENCIIQVMEETGFTSFLSVDGSYSYSTYNRLLSEHGTELFGGEIAASVSSIAQFAKAQQIEQPITGVYLVGFDEADQNLAAQAIDRVVPGCKVEPLRPDAAKQRMSTHSVETFYVTGALLDTDKNGNLLAQLSNGSKERKQRSFIRKAIVALAALTLVMGAASGAALMAVHQKQVKLDDINAYLNAEHVAAQTAYFDALSGMSAQIRSRTDAIDALKQARDTYPVPDSRVDGVLQRCAQGLVTVEILSYDSGTGELKVNTEADVVDNIYQFIDILAQEDMFHVEEYSGYLYNESTQTWSVAVVVTLTADAAGEGE